MQTQTTTQNKAILSHLAAGNSLTPLDALSLFGCLRLGARIFDLRAEGHAIKSERVVINKKTVAKYSMIIV